MKVSNEKVLSELLPALNKIITMQSRGMVTIDGRTAYALSKNHSKAISVEKHFEVFRKNLLTKYVKVRKEDNSFMQKEVTPATETSQAVMDWDFIDETEKDIMKKELSDFFDKDSTFEPYKISSDAISEIHNFPIDALAPLENAGILSELKLV